MDHIKHAEVEAKFYKKLENKTVQCRLCNHFCTIKNNEAGICGARENKSGQLTSLVYGRPVALNIDPIEKKPLFHFLPGSAAFSLGTYGCNFRCLNCQNFDLSQEKRIAEKNEKITWVSSEKIIELALKSENRSIAYTYNEPTIYTEYALDIMKLARVKGLKNVWVTNGFMSAEALVEILPLADAFNIDLKSGEEDFYRTVCGARLEPVLENLKTIKRAGVHLELTTLVIPSLSDDKKMFTDLAGWIVRNLGVDTPWHLSRFSPTISWKLKDLPATDQKNLDAAYQAAKKAGLKFVYLGNVSSKKENTYCPECDELNIKRSGYEITRYDQAGVCFKCRADLHLIDAKV